MRMNYKIKYAKGTNGILKYSLLNNKKKKIDVQMKVVVHNTYKHKLTFRAKTRRNVVFLTFNDQQMFWNFHTDSDGS